MGIVKGLGFIAVTVVDIVCVKLLTSATVHNLPGHRTLNKLVDPYMQRCNERVYAQHLAALEKTGGVVPPSRVLPA